MLLWEFVLPTGSIAYGTGSKFDVVAYIRPDYLLTAPLRPLLREPTVRACTSPGGDALWTIPRGLLDKVAGQARRAHVFHSTSSPEDHF